MPHEPSPAAQALPTLRIIFLAMIAGVLAFGAVAVFLLKPDPETARPSVLPALLVPFAAVLLVAWVLVGRRLRTGLARRLMEAPPDEAPGLLRGGFFSSSLVAGALTEAYCLFALTVYLLTGAPASLVATGAGLLALAAQLPSEGRFHSFAEEVMGRRPS